MKDKQLHEKLKMYADCTERKQEVMYGAYAEMDRVAYRGYDSGSRVKRKGVYRWVLAALPMAVVFVLLAVSLFSILSNLGGNGNQGNNSDSGYSFASVVRRVSSKEEISALDGAKYMEPYNDFFAEYYVYTGRLDGDVYMTAIKYKVERNGNIEEVTVISDLKGGLTEFKDSIPKRENYLYKEYDVYENGEYYSGMSMKKSGRVYYVNIMSPVQFAGEFYEDLLF